MSLQPPFSTSSPKNASNKDGYHQGDESDNAGLEQERADLIDVLEKMKLGILTHEAVSIDAASK